jgi:hypothetical protein
MKPPCSIEGCEESRQAKQMCWKHFNRWRNHGDPLKQVHYMDLRESFRARADKNGPVPEERPSLGPCWLWTGGTNGTYGKIRNLYAHRVSYELSKGQIPAGLQIDHLCRNTVCVNPDHLEAVTGRTNLLRARGFAARQAAQTECIHGHPLAGDNLYVDKRSRRHCRECRSRRSQEARAKKQAAAGKPRLTVITHGASRYNSGCRCDICRAGKAQRQRDAVARRAQDPAAADRAGHGKQSTYRNTGCRCTPCATANRDAVRAARARKKEATQ